MNSIKKIKENALKNHIPIIMDETLDKIFEIVGQNKFDNILEIQINLYEGDAVEILPTLNEKYDMVFIDASKGKYPFFLEQSLRMLSNDGIIFADNILYKGYVMSDYNKHKQRTAVTHLREYIKNATENEKLNTIIYESGDGLAVSFFKNNSKYILKS